MKRFPGNGNSKILKNPGKFIPGYPGNQTLVATSWCFAYCIVGPLHWINFNGIMNKEICKSILEDVMLSFASESMPTA